MSDNVTAPAGSPGDNVVVPPDAENVSVVPQEPSAPAAVAEQSRLHPDPAQDPPPVPQTGQATIAPNGTAPATPPAEPVPELDPTDYSKYKIGDTVAAGLKIGKIFFQTNEFIIFASDDGGIYFGGKNVPDSLKEAIAEFYRLTLDAEALKGAHRSDINRLFGYSLARAAMLPQGAEIGKAFEYITKFIDDHSPVKRVFLRTDDCTVYVDSADVLTFDYPDLPAHLAPAVVEFRRLLQITTASLSSVDRSTAEGLLGTQLAVAFQTQSGDVAAFAPARDFIQKRLEAAHRIDYVLASAAAAVLLGVLGGVVYAGFAWSGQFLRAGSLFLGALGGVVGAFISVLQRSATLDVQQFVPRKQVMVQAVVRLGLGSMFGLLLICAAFAGIVNVASTPFALFLIAVVAGFSERLMPDLLTKLATTVDTPATAAGAGGKPSPSTPANSSATLPASTPTPSPAAAVASPSAPAVTPASSTNDQNVAERRAG